MLCPITGVSLRFSDPKRAEGEMMGTKYRIVKLLGKGGMGAVYEAEHVDLAKKVAIKILLPEASVKPSQVERFKREARSAASLGHENIVEIFDLDTSEDGSVYIVMEYLSGIDLADLMGQAGGPLPVHKVADIACQVARGLGKAHEHGIVHRDLKPENIFLVRRPEKDQVKIVDFGIAMMRQQGEAGRLTAEGVLIGTPFYMSPEQARGERDLDARTDIYALGTVIFEMLTGKVPFDGDTYLEILAKHQLEPPPLLHETNPGLRCPADLEGLLRVMLEKPRDRRPSSMAEVERVLAHFAVDPSGETAPAQDMPESHKDGFAETIIAYRSSPRVPENTQEAVSTPRVSGPAWTEDGTREMTAQEGMPWRRPKIVALLVALGVVAVLAVGVAVAVVAKGGTGERTKAAPRPPEFLVGKASEAADVAGHSEDPSRVVIEIEVDPAEATISIDGQIHEGNPVEVQVGRDKPVTLRAEAPGHVTLEKEIEANQDRTFTFSLTPLHTDRDIKKTKKVAVTPPAPVPPPEDQGTSGKKKVKLDKENPYLLGK